MFTSAATIDRRYCCCLLKADEILGELENESCEAEIKHGEKPEYYDDMLAGRAVVNRLALPPAPRVQDPDDGGVLLALEEVLPEHGLDQRAVAVEQEVDESDDEVQSNEIGGDEMFYDILSGMEGVHGVHDDAPGGTCLGDGPIAPGAPPEQPVAPESLAQPEVDAVGPEPSDIGALPEPPEALADIVDPPPSPPPPQQQAQAQGRSAVGGSTQPETHEWGPFRLTWVVPTDRCKYGAWQGTWRFHRLDTVKCTKRLAVQSEGGVLDTKSLVQDWCLQVVRFNRKRDHGGWNPRLQEALPAEVMQAQAS